MKLRLQPAVLGIALALGALALQAHTAAAATLGPNMINQDVQSTRTAQPVEKVGHKGRRHRKARRHHRRYDRRHHGHRYKHRRGRHKHYYHGYWYAAPWWLGVPAYGTPYYDPYYDEEPTAVSDDEHIAWCEGKYRSYNAETDTFRGYDGLDHRCNSPYN